MFKASRPPPEPPPSEQVPTSVAEALGIPEWRDAVHREFRSQIQLGVYQKVRRTDVDGKPIYTLKWLFSRKRSGKAKARLVVQGYQFLPNHYYKDTFAPVATISTVFLVLALAAAFDLNLSAVDCRTAFLNSHLEDHEQFVVQVPEGFEQLGFIQGADDFVLNVQRALYGSPVAPRKWHKTLVKFLLEFGFKQCPDDQCLFYFQGKPNSSEGFHKFNFLVIALWVDDLIIVRRGEKLYKSFLTAIKKRFSITIVENPTDVLGLEITRDCEAGYILVHQKNRILKLLRKWGMEESKCNGCPIDPSLAKKLMDKNPLEYRDLFKDVDTEAEQSYLSFNGVLRWLVNVRVDLLVPAYVIARFAHCCNAEHLPLVYSILRYLSRTMSHGRVFRRVETSLKHYGMSDASHGGDQNCPRSLGGHLTFLAGGVVSV
ncbi:MAG: reverse transcriptase domain-containing protein, partial [Myxococcota bacterium]